ncbi:hypothetical protein P7K49_032125 [Saguinus oedipus]|uniref:Uncharacterized protein n=1 Tax=Saguinus oedipus TaxID=9490 RepID=A0ABQ9TXF7_SAGOE|nr:hypothetical protein P7K49_032125 [Saguinus oedipus]
MAGLWVSGEGGPGAPEATSKARWLAAHCGQGRGGGWNQAAWAPAPRQSRAGVGEGGPRGFRWDPRRAPEKKHAASGLLPRFHSSLPSPSGWATAPRLPILYPPPSHPWVFWNPACLESHSSRKLGPRTQGRLPGTVDLRAGGAGAPWRGCCRGGRALGARAIPLELGENRDCRSWAQLKAVLSRVGGDV